jgi:hypothetical protein
MKGFFMGIQHSCMKETLSPDRQAFAGGQEVRRQQQSSEYKRPPGQDFAYNPPKQIQRDGQERSPRNDHQEQPLWDYFHNSDAMAQILKNSQEQESPRRNNHQEQENWLGKHLEDMDQRSKK